MNANLTDSGTLARGYLAMAQVFSYPDADAWRRLTESGLVSPALAREDLEAEYLAAFEVGRDASPVPPFEGMHRGDLGRDWVLEDLLRFYEFFAVRLNEANREYPDHLATELEFLAWLCLQEQAARHEGRNVESLRLAQRDFIDRHLAAWLPVFLRRLEAFGTAYAEYGSALGELVDDHRKQLENANQ